MDLGKPNFQGCDTVDGTFANLYDDAGDEITLTADAGYLISIDIYAGVFRKFNYLKVRSGTSGSAVAQGAEREIVFHCSWSY